MVKENDMLCQRCKRTMNKVLHFEKDRKFQYNECPECREKTKNKRIHFEDNEKLKVLF